MTLYARKLVLALITTIAATAMPSAQAHDIIANGDFHDGKTHWQGDGDAPDVGGKLIVTLKPDKWTVVVQKFSDNNKHLQLKVTYSLSDGCSLAVKRSSSDSMVAPLTSHAFEQATGLENHISDVMLSSYAEWMILVVNDGYTWDRTPVSFSETKENPRTFTGTISGWNGFDNNTLCLAFPPGTGTVTITDVELIPPKSAE
jgi:hypothetical protein